MSYHYLNKFVNNNWEKIDAPLWVGYMETANNNIYLFGWDDGKVYVFDGNSFTYINDGPPLQYLAGGYRANPFIYKNTLCAIDQLNKKIYKYNSGDSDDEFTKVSWLAGI